MHEIYRKKFLLFSKKNYQIIVFFIEKKCPIIFVGIVLQRHLLQNGLGDSKHSFA
jgi:hypothetical protein